MSWNSPLVKARAARGRSCSCRAPTKIARPRCAAAGIARRRRRCRRARARRGSRRTACAPVTSVSWNAASALADVDGDGLVVGRRRAAERRGVARAQVRVRRGSRGASRRDVCRPSRADRASAAGSAPTGCRCAPSQPYQRWPPTFASVGVLRSTRARPLRARQAVGEARAPAGGTSRTRCVAGARQPRVVEQPLAERDRRRLAGHAIGRIGDCAAAATGPSARMRRTSASVNASVGARQRAVRRLRVARDARTATRRQRAELRAACQSSLRDAALGREPLDVPCCPLTTSNVRSQRPGHVEQQALGAIGAGPRRRHRRPVVHAVPMLGHVRVDAHRLRRARRRARAHGEVDGEMLADRRSDRVRVAYAIDVARCSRRVVARAGAALRRTPCAPAPATNAAARATAAVARERSLREPAASRTRTARRRCATRCARPAARGRSASHARDQFACSTM